MDLKITIFSVGWKNDILIKKTEECLSAAMATEKAECSCILTDSFCHSGTKILLVIQAKCLSLSLFPMIILLFERSIFFRSFRMSRRSLTNTLFLFILSRDYRLPTMFRGMNKRSWGSIKPFFVQCMVTLKFPVTVKPSEACPSRLH